MVLRSIAANQQVMEALRRGLHRIDAELHQFAVSTDRATDLRREREAILADLEELDQVVARLAGL